MTLTQKITTAFMLCVVMGAGVYDSIVHSV